MLGRVVHVGVFERATYGLDAWTDALIANPECARPGALQKYVLGQLVVWLRSAAGAAILAIAAVPVIVVGMMGEHDVFSGIISWVFNALVLILLACIEPLGNCYYVLRLKFRYRQLIGEIEQLQERQKRNEAIERALVTIAKHLSRFEASSSEAQRPPTPEQTMATQVQERQRSP